MTNTFFKGWGYQSFGEHQGQRDMEHRFDVMKLPKSFEEKTVIDIGCNIGVACIESKKRGAKRVVGIDYTDENIDIANQIAKEHNFEIEYYKFDVNDGLDELKSIIGDEKFDYTFVLSVWGWVDKQKLADIINHYTTKFCWIEGHGKNGVLPNWEYEDTKDNMKLKFDKFLNYQEVTYLGDTIDSPGGKRHNFKLKF